jgi:hypothetical protein
VTRVRVSVSEACSRPLRLLPRWQLRRPAPGPSRTVTVTGPGCLVPRARRAGGPGRASVTSLRLCLPPRPELTGATDGLAASSPTVTAAASRGRWHSARPGAGSPAPRPCRRRGGGGAARATVSQSRRSLTMTAAGTGVTGETRKKKNCFGIEIRSPRPPPACQRCPAGPSSESDHQ